PKADQMERLHERCRRKLGQQHAIRAGGHGRKHRLEPDLLVCHNDDLRVLNTFPYLADKPIIPKLWSSLEKNYVDLVKLMTSLDQIVGGIEFRDNINSLGRQHYAQGASI